MTLLKSVVLLDVMQVVSSNDDGSLHLHTCYNTSQNSPTDTDITSEGTLLVDVCSLNGLQHNNSVYEKMNNFTTVSMTR